MQNSLFIQACRNIDTPRPPIWLMRQAGRYLPEYRAVRKRYDFLAMCHTPELAAEVTLQPLRRFQMDAAIIFSDILVVAEAMGGQLTFEDKVGPVFHNPLRCAADIDTIRNTGAAETLTYVPQAIALVQKEQPQTPIIGFAGAPFTVAAYWVEGLLSRDLSTTKQMLYTEPALAHRLLQKISHVTIEHLNAQIRAGAAAIQIFESWGHLLSYKHFQEFALPYIVHIIQSLHNPQNCPVIVFCRNTGTLWPLLQNSGATVLSIDWSCDLPNLRSQLKPGIAVQGNLDPFVLCSSPQHIEKQFLELHKNMPTHKGWIVNLGHGVLPPTNPDNVAHLVELVKNTPNSKGLSS